ncbi:MAG: hypothetical protein AB3N14_07795 [Flavobacteriaceae bacterium]
MTQISNADTFGPTLTHLRKTMRDFGPLVKPIDGMTELVTDIDDILLSIGDLITAADDIDDIIIILGEVLEFLDPIPIVGEIAEVISATTVDIGETLKDAISTAKDINNETIKPVAKVLGDVKTGLNDVRKVVVDISQKAPGYINTIEILHYLSEIAEPLTEVLKGTDSADKLHSLLATFNKVQKDLGEVLDKLNPVLTGVDDGVKALTKVLNEIQKAMGDDVTKVLNGIKDAATHLKPISDGFHRVEEAIKPLAWVLDALACIFDTILKPIIDAILDATGLNVLVQDAENAIFKKLHIGPVMKMADGNISEKKVSGASGSVSSTKGVDANRLWDAAESALGHYRSGKDGGTKAAIWGLIGAITNTAIDPNKPSIPPPFNPPKTPPLSPAAIGDNNNMNTTFLYTPRKTATIDARIISKLKNPPVRVYTHSLQSLLASKGSSSINKLPKVNPKEWPKTAALIDSIGVLVKNLDLLSPAAAKFEGALGAFKASFSLPTTFSHQVTDLSSLINDSVDILDFFESLNINFVTDLVRPFDDIAHDQKTKMGQLTKEIPALKSTMSTLEMTSRNIIKSIPKTKFIDQAIRRIEGWSMSITQTVQLVNKAREEDAKKGNKQKAAIDAFASQVETISSTLQSKVATISSDAKASSKSIAALQAALDNYTKNLEEITKHSNLISNKALPVADQAAHILGVVNSIIDPLSGLLQAENCVDANAPLKKYSATAIALLNDAGKAAATAQPKAFVEFAEKLAEKELPLTAMAEAVQTAANSLTTNTIAPFKNNSSNLIDRLDNLSKELVQSKSYTVTITTRQGHSKKITVNNDFFTQDLLTKANNIINALGYETQTV